MPSPLRIRLPRGARKALDDDLYPWFLQTRRSLPWRENRTPYRVWISELMLQQTRVEAVVAYYQRWMQTFPCVEALAGASQQDVLKAWEGLGYYARARNLHAAAKMIVEERNGVFPATAKEWQALPGVGVYTSAAISSLSRNEVVAVLDGNVERVLSRWTAWGEDVRKGTSKRALQDLADRLVSTGKPGLHNEAMMELGALVCLPGKPKCQDCPVRRICKAYRHNETSAYPVKSKKKAVPVVRVGAALTRDTTGRILIAQRRNEGMLGGMWEFPGGKLEAGETMRQCVVRELNEELGIDVTVGPRFTRVKHIYSHFQLDMDVYWADWSGGEPQRLECSDFAWVTVEEMSAYPFGGADLKVIAKLRAQIPTPGP